MADINVERKRPSIWPWIIGLLVLALAIWGVAELVEDEGGAEEQAVAQVEEWQPEVEPAAVPAPADEDATASERPLDELAPLDVEDVGQRVRVSGEAVSVTPKGFWLLSGRDLLFVATAQEVAEGDQVRASGTLREVQDVDALALPGGDDGWRIVDVLRLEATTVEVQQGTTSSSR